MDEEIKRQNYLREGLKFVLKWEGQDYVDDPSDPGGETKYGISKKAHPNEDIKALTKERALEIYVQDYWVPAGCDTIPYPYNVAVFDTAVNCGVSRAKQWLRDSKDVIQFMNFRREHYINIINKNTNLMRFAKGWWNRMTDLNKYIAINGGFDSALGRSENHGSPV